jgi:hypothetical protein
MAATGGNPWKEFRVEKREPLRPAGSITHLLLLLSGAFIGGVVGLALGLRTTEIWGVFAITALGAGVGLHLMGRFLVGHWFRTMRR